MFVWDLDLESLVGKFVYVELDDSGIKREGKLSRVRYQDHVINGDTVQRPVAIELNGDPLDLIRFDQFTNLTVR